MNLVFDLSGRLCWFLAVIARLLIGALVLLVVTDVAVRNAGLRPLAWAVNTSEFFLLYITFLAMPWLVRKKGHVFVIFLRVVLPGGARQVLSKIVYLGCIALCLYLGWIALNSLMLAIERGTYEMRTFDIPKWVVFAPMVLAFFLAALEWLRYLLGHDDFYDSDPAETLGH
ncbi:MAG: TRAP-type C4-dicarboxylate transport system, small permease component [Rhodobacteraceae bacterium HLUCCA12]|nr:MAG: TRAP-type C4-dicarboxylate transport system, small permease component [Rhodobacteraceae bacterium HLUCCA12]